MFGLAEACRLSSLFTILAYIVGTATADLNILLEDQELHAPVICHLPEIHCVSVFLTRKRSLLMCLSLAMLSRLGHHAAFNLCRKEIDEALRVGAITEVMTAFSRSKVNSKKEYVQTKVSICFDIRPSWSSRGSPVRGKSQSNRIK